MESTRQTPAECGHPCLECGGTMVQVEYPHGPYHYDGISEVACANSFKEENPCTNRKGRWCGDKLKPKEVEPPFCAGGPHPTV